MCKLEYCLKSVLLEIASSLLKDLYPSTVILLLRSEKVRLLSPKIAHYAVKCLFYYFSPSFGLKLWSSCIKRDCKCWGVLKSLIMAPSALRLFEQVCIKTLQCVFCDVMKCQFFKEFFYIDIKEGGK